MTHQSFTLKEPPATLNFLLAGVGGQGAILASNVLAELGMNLGFDVKQAEVHGMSQRGGSVISQVRWAEHVYSPTIPQGQADILLAFEMSEAVRFIHQVKPSGLVLVNDHMIVPITVTAGGGVYPAQEEIAKTLIGYTQYIVWLKAVAAAEEIGTAKASNVVMLGALSAFLPYDPSAWLEVIKSRVPARYLTLNVQAFEAGRTLMKAKITAGEKI